MNKNLNLVEILKNCPKGTELYSSVYGTIKLVYVKVYTKYPITTSMCSFTGDGRILDGQGECVLFPSKDQRDWGNFVPPIKKWNPNELKPFDKILVRDYEDSYWYADLFGFIDKKSIVGCNGTYWNTTVPYNEETKHLLGTKDSAPEKYKWWEE